MLKATDITQPGFYWLFDPQGGEPVVVEVGPPGVPVTQLQVFFTGREDSDLLADLAGEFLPARPPIG